MFLTVTLVFIVFILIFYYRFRRSKLHVFEKLGIDGPKPDAFFGNLAEMKEKPLFQLYLDWKQKYGPIFGYYEGPVPVLVTSDLEILKQVFVKQFSKFHARKYYPLQPDPEDDAVHIFSARGDRWKRLRLIINPTFSASKMKLMSPLIHKSIDDMMENLENYHKNNDTVEIYSGFQGLTLDVIGSCAFGMDVQSQKNSSDPFLYRCRQIFMDGSTRPFLLMIALLVPEFGKFWNLLLRIIHQFKEDPTKWLTSALERIIKLRKNEEHRRVDLLQLMIDAEDFSPNLTKSFSRLTMTRDSTTRNSSMSSEGSDKEQNNLHYEVNRAIETIKGDDHVFENDDRDENRNGPVLHVKQDKQNGGVSHNELFKNGTIKNGIHKHIMSNGHSNGHVNGSCDSACVDKPLKKALSHEEIKAQSVLFLLAGYETTSTAMAYTIYELVLNPDVQKKLQDEIDRQCPDDGQQLTYDMVHNLTYMEMVISETLRKYPLASTVTSRLCMESCTINGIHIPKGVVVQPNVWAIHYDPDVWGPVDPQIFYPERFSPEYRDSCHSMAFMAFGVGPRNCVGMRFAFLEMKLSLARIFRKYTLKRCPQTQVPLKFREGGTIVPRDGVHVQLEER